MKMKKRTKETRMRKGGARLIKKRREERKGTGKRDGGEIEEEDVGKEEKELRNKSVKKNGRSLGDERNGIEKKKRKRNQG